MVSMSNANKLIFRICWISWLCVDPLVDWCEKKKERRIQYSSLNDLKWTIVLAVLTPEGVHEVGIHSKR